MRLSRGSCAGSFLLLGVLLVFVPAAAAQCSAGGSSNPANGGQVVVHVRDAGGGAFQGQALVRLTSATGGLTQMTVTRGTEYVIFPGLAPGSYVVEVTAPDEGRGMVSPLAHGAGAGDPHGPEKDALTAFGTRHQGVRPEGAAAFSSAGGHRAQFVVIGEFVGQAGAAAIGCDVHQVMGAGCQAQHQARTVRKLRCLVRYEGPLDPFCRRR